MLFISAEMVSQLTEYDHDVPPKAANTCASNTSDVKYSFSILLQFIYNIFGLWTKLDFGQLLSNKFV